jgi:hypothetical protein
VPELADAIFPPECSEAARGLDTESIRAAAEIKEKGRGYHPAQNLSAAHGA